MELKETFYISHGSPTLAIDDSLPARPFLQSFRERVYSQKPKSILIISGHWEASEPTVNCIHGPNDTIHDFYNFPDHMYKLKYPAPGAPELAKKVKDLLMASGIKRVDEDKERGLDHGAWVPLMLMYPEADIPVCQLSVQTNKDETYHYNLGRALAPLREEGVLIVGSGSATHNLGNRGTFGSVASWALDFDNWLKEALLNGSHLNVEPPPPGVYPPSGAINQTTHTHNHPVQQMQTQIQGPLAPSCSQYVLSPVQPQVDVNNLARTVDNIQDILNRLLQAQTLPQPVPPLMNFAYPVNKPIHFHPSHQNPLPIRPEVSAKRVEPQNVPRVREDGNGSSGFVHKEELPKRRRFQEEARVVSRCEGSQAQTYVGSNPFVRAIREVTWPVGYKLLSLSPYDGTGDPEDHLAIFRHKMAFYEIPEAFMCRVFPTTLVDSVRRWFDDLKEDSIESFA